MARSANPKLSTTIYIRPDQDIQLKALNQRTKVSASEYIRQGIDLILEKNKAELPGQIRIEGL